MKKVLFILVLLIGSSVFSQNWKSRLRAITLNNNVYETLVDIKLIQFSDLKGNLLGQKRNVVLSPADNSKIRYKIIGEDGDFTLIKLLPRLKINADSTITVDDPTSINDNASKYVYAIKTENFGLNQKKLLSEKIIGVPLIYPFKLRLQDRGDGAQITTSFNVGYSFGLRVKTNKLSYQNNFITFIPYGFGLGASKYFYKQTDGEYSAKTDGVAVTYYTGGVMVNFNKVNVGLLAGKDAMIDKRNNWAYQGDWWWSFGFGFKFDKD